MSRAIIIHELHPKIHTSRSEDNLVYNTAHLFILDILKKIALGYNCDDDEEWVPEYYDKSKNIALVTMIQSLYQEYHSVIWNNNILLDTYLHVVESDEEEQRLQSKYQEKIHWRFTEGDISDFWLEWQCAKDASIDHSIFTFWHPKIYVDNKNHREITKLIWTSEDNSHPYTLFYHPLVFIKIEETLGIEFENFPFSIQSPFLGFLIHATQEDMKRLRNYLDHAQTIEEKYARLRVFLATTKWRWFGEMILNIHEKLIEKLWDEWGKIGNELFAKYAEIMTIAEDDAINISWEFYWSTSDARFDRDKYLNSILDYANRLLEKTYEVLQSKGDIHSWSNEVQNIRWQLAQYGKIIASTDLTGNFHLKDILKMLRIKNESYQWWSISDEKIDILKSFYHLNYKKHPQKEEIFEAIDKILQHDSQDSASTFLFFSHKWIPVLTTKFKKLSNGDMYMWSFNSPWEMHGSKLWSILLPYLLEEYSDYNIQWEVITTSPELLAYYERFGFEVRRNKNGKHIIRQYGNLSFYQIVRPAREK